MPLSHTQDIGGPLARTVADLAIVLDATVGYDRRPDARPDTVRVRLHLLVEHGLRTA